MFALILALSMQGQAPPQPPVLARYSVTEGGVIFEVNGWTGPDGMVWFHRSDPFNAASKAEALAKQRAPASPSPVPNYGLTLDHIYTESHNGIVATTPKAKSYAAAVHGSTDGDNSPAKIHLTVIGTEGQRQRVLADIKSHPAFSGIKDRLLVQDYGPNEWAVNPNLGFQTNGSPTISLESEDGTELWRSPNYSVGPDGLATACQKGLVRAEEIRRRHPDYDPLKTPGPNGCPLGFQRQHWPAIAIAACIALWFLTHRKTSPKDHEEESTP